MVADQTSHVCIHHIYVISRSKYFPTIQPNNDCNVNSIIVVVLNWPGITVCPTAKWIYFSIDPRGLGNGFIDLLLNRRGKPPQTGQMLEKPV